MLYTPTEAAHVSCPMGYADGHEISCRGERCAAWRWAPATYPDDGARQVILATNPLARRPEEAGNDGPAGWEFRPAAPAIDEPAQWVEPANNAAKRRKGYCGIAGRPLGVR